MAKTKAAGSSSVLNTTIYKWIYDLKDKSIDSSVWMRGPKRSKLVHSETNEPTLVRIADMHDMELVNAIKWCIKIARSSQNGLYDRFGESKAQILAPVPQWRCLLEEGYKRQLRIVTGCYDPQCLQHHPHERCAIWYKQALTAIGLYEMDGGDSA